ncbi:MAG: winged helix-turn-helix domain-containing protein [Pyrinomonadaceae bacterium]
MTVQIQKTYRLGEFELDPNKRLLKREDGRVMHLSHLPFRVLVYFVENRERIVTRQELLDQFWEGRDVYDITLTKCVGAIRKALGEDSENPRFIETRWAEGYRYIGPFTESLSAANLAMVETEAVEKKLAVEPTQFETPDLQPDYPDVLAAEPNGAILSPEPVSATVPPSADLDPTPPARVASNSRWAFAGGWRLKALLASGVVVLTLFGTWTLFFHAKPESKITGPDWSRVKSTKLTNQSGAEYSVNLAPDGKMFIYADRSSGNWDIYWQRVGGRNTVNLTRDSLADDLHPAYSPDGNYIAFRSERKSPGVYVMEATSENVRRVSDFGYYPAWSPDGKELVISAGSFVDPNNRGLVPSQLWVIDVATGAKRSLTTGDAIQASWSPSGNRIAYWGLQGGGQRDIWTMPASGGEAVPVTNDQALDWNPVWSPDGKYLYFASDRGGSMNFWRVPLDETSGQLQGAPEAVITPSVYSQHLSFSRDGSRLAYAQKSETLNLQRVPFDPLSERITGEPEHVTQGTKYVTDPDLSPDDEWFAFSSQGEKQEDILILKRDGTELRQLTNDVFRDRGPRWAPDGQRIAFYSDRGGRFEIWSINSDGTNLRQITYTVDQSAVFPIWSPDGKRMLFKQRGAPPFFFDLNRLWTEQTPQQLSAIEGVRNNFWASSWSPDGRRLAGTWILNGIHYVHVYDFEAKTYENFGLRGLWPIWLSDNRRLLFHRDGRLHVLDTQTRKSHELFSVEPYAVGTVGATRDARTIYFTVQKTESDIWLLTRE